MSPDLERSPAPKPSSALAFLSIASMLNSLGCQTHSPPPSSQSPAQVAPEPSASPRTRTEAALRHRVQELAASELIAMLPDLEVDAPATRVAATKIAGALFTSGANVNLTADEAQILALKAAPRHALTTQWLRGASIAQPRAARSPWRIAPLLSPDAQLPPGRLLRLLVVLRMDFGSVMVEQTAQRNIQHAKSNYYNADDTARIEAARKAALASAPQHARLIADAIADVAQHPDLGPDGPRIAALLLSLRDFDPSECAAFEQAAATYAARPAADPWLSQIALGRAAICRAWADRGAGVLGDTTPQQFDAFHQGLDRAFDRLMLAHRLRPDRPDALALLITVAMGGGNAAHLTPEYWHHRAVAIDPSCRAAYQALATAALPRWGGGAAAAAALFRRAADAADADGGLGRDLVAWLPAFFEDDPRILADPAVAAAVVDALRPSFAPAAGGADPSFERSVALAIAFQARDARLMLDVLAEADWAYRSPDPQIFPAAWSDMVRFADEHSPAYGQPLAQARAAGRRADVQAAAALAEPLLARPGLPERVRAELRTLIAASTAPSDYDAGREITLAGPDAPRLFVARNGQSTQPGAASDGAAFGFVAPSAPWSERPLLVSSIKLGRRYALWGRIRTTARDDARRALSLGRLTLIACTRDDAPGRGIAAAIQAPRPSIEAGKEPNPMVVEQTFRFVVDAADSTFEVDGQPQKILPFQVAPESDWGDWLAIGGATDHPASTLELLELKAQRLADPAPVAPATPAR